MNNLITTQPYPTNAFHLVIRDAAFEIAYNTQAPDALIAMELLSHMSASAQGRYDVKLPTDNTRPLSLYCMLVAESGERMTSVHNLVAKPLYESDKECAKKFQNDFQEYEQQLREWTVVNQALCRKLGKAAEMGERFEDVQAELKAWSKQKPVKPRARRIMRENISERAIMEALEGDGESVSFSSDEGEIIFNSGAFNNVGTMNKIWDGAEILALDRGNGVSVVARDPRVTVSLKAQPQVLKALLDRRGAVMRSSGLWARFLIGYPASTQGMRYSYQLDKSWAKLRAFHECTHELLNKSGHGRQLLEFSPEAKESWFLTANHIEQQLRPMGGLHDVKDGASKSMEIVGRVAALLHIYSKQEGQISLDTLQRAIAIVQWHLCEFKRLFSPEAVVEQKQVDAQTLGNYLGRLKVQTNVIMIPKNFVLRNGPVRPSKRFEEALGVLITCDHVQVVPGPKKQNFIHLNPQIFGLPVVPIASL